MLTTTGGIILAVLCLVFFRQILITVGILVAFVLAAIKGLAAFIQDSIRRTN